MLDPAIGRFMTIDPMADFVNDQSPYVVADNNPIGYIDAYGLGTPGILRWLLGGSGRNCSCKQREGVVGFVGRLFEPKPNGKRRKSKKKKKKSKKTSSNPDPSDEASGDKGRSPISGIDFIQSGFADLGTPSIEPPQITLPRLSIPNPDIPVPLGGRIGFDKDIKFEGSKDTFRDKDHTEKTLSDLIKTLKEYPQLKLLILGNTSYKTTRNVNANTPAKVNGQSGTVGELQLKRARAVEQFLINRGIDWRRITVGNGTINTSGGKSNMSSTFILTNPNN